MIVEEIDEVIRKYLPEEQFLILAHLNSPFWHQVIDRHVNIYKETLCTMQVTQEPAAFLNNYLEVKTKLNFWLEFRNYIDNLKLERG